MSFAAPARRSNTAPRAATMYSAFRQLAGKWLRIPPEPGPPPGDEASARVFLASPKYLNYLRILWAVRSGFILLLVLIPGMIAIAIFSQERDPAPLIVVLSLWFVAILVLMLQSLFQLAIVQLDYEKRWYLVTDRSLRIREGVTTVREITFTFANIQNLSVTQGPVQRLLGIADLKVETAGGGNVVANQHQQGAMQNLHTAYFRGIDNAEELKQLVSDRMRGYRDSGLGDHDDPENHHAPAADASHDLAEALAAVLDEARLLRVAAGR